MKYLLSSLLILFVAGCDKSTLTNITISTPTVTVMHASEVQTEFDYFVAARGYGVFEMVSINMARFNPVAAYHYNEKILEFSDVNSSEDYYLVIKVNSDKVLLRNAYHESNYNQGYLNPIYELCSVGYIGYYEWNMIEDISAVDSGYNYQIFISVPKHDAIYFSGRTSLGDMCLNFSQIVYSDPYSGAKDEVVTNTVQIPQSSIQSALDQIP